MATDQDSEAFYEGSDLEALSDLPNYYGWIASMLDPRGDTLEVGAGIGNFTASYRARVGRLALVEPSQHASALAARFMDDPEVEVVRGTLQQALSVRPDWTGVFHSLVMVNVLEHVEDDAGLLEHCARALRPEGRLLVAVPALPWLYGTLDDLVDHVRRYTRRSLRAVAEQAGFEVRSVRYFDALGVAPWFVTGRILRSRSFHRGAAQLYDRVGVPLTRRAERLVPPLLGKNVALVATRR